MVERRGQYPNYNIPLSEHYAMANFFFGAFTEKVFKDSTISLFMPGPLSGTNQEPWNGFP
jgi:hypothetical protein